MARKSNERDWEFEPDGLMEDILRAVPPGSVAFRGWLGRGDSGALRLFRTLALEECLELDPADVLWSLPLRDEGGSTAIWVRREASIRVVQVTTADEDRRLREGPIAGACCDPDPCSDPDQAEAKGLLTSYAFTKRTSSRVYCC